MWRLLGFVVFCVYHFLFESIHEDLRIVGDRVSRSLSIQPIPRQKKIEQQRASERAGSFRSNVTHASARPSAIDFVRHLSCIW